MDCTYKTRDLFLSAISLVYTFAFGSLFPQIQGLYGRNGIIPVTSVIKNHATAAGTQNAEKLFWKIPTFIYFLPLEPENSMELFCIIGLVVGFSSSIFKFLRNSFIYLFLFLLYLSLFKVGGTFLWFQWDTLLLEVGFLSILVAPLTGLKSSTNKYLHKQLPWLLVRWLAFRLMFSSGVVKLTSGCPTWWKLTALNYHYESQCLPTSLAWWAHQLPPIIQKLSVVSTYIIEIGLPLLFYCPIRSWRLFAAYGQILLMFLIIFTGNYNFFNLLTIALHLSLLDDINVDHLINKFSFGYFSQNHIKDSGKSKNRVLTLNTSLNICGAAIFSFFIRRYFFYKDSLMITFTMHDLNELLASAIPMMFWISSLLFILTTLKIIFKYINDSTLTIPGKLKYIFVCLLTIPPCIFLYSISMVSISTVLPNNQPNNIWPVIHKWHSLSSKYELTHSYGLFRRMTGVGGRPEIIIEGSNNLERGWKEINFKYKPGNLSSIPLWAVPHQPRLDWQLWFAALGSYQRNPWFVSLIHRILTNQKEVMDLLGENPFPNQPPKYVRALLYKYHYTKMLNSKIPTDWWSRDSKDDYLFSLNNQSQQLYSFLKYHNLEPLGKSSKPIKFPLTEKFLSYIRTSISSLHTPYFLWFLALCILFFRIISRLIEAR